ncbi:IS91 family transposase [Ectothiorhodospiraceae bacterium BW-2]|nr:IS91 family transposase [Ectothiorhodospiraceae bacterium BW-2]
MAAQTPGCIPAPYRARRPADTPLYRVVQNHLETFLALCHDDWEQERVSPHAERELRRFLECGILAYGFARARCDECGHDFLIAFSCKGRGVCPSCNTRRMAETAAHLTDHVLPRLPVRQWVLSLPKRLRYHLQHDRKALSSALRIFLDAVEQHLREQSPGAGPKARTGAVAFIHRFGSSLNEHTHFHVVFIDGIFEPDPEQGVHFIEVEELDADDAEAVQTQIRRRILRAFVRRGLLEKADRQEMEQWDHGGGFSLDASVRIEAHDRRGMERLLRYCARPPFAADRLEEIDAQRLIYHLSKPGPDGQTQIILSPLELIGRIAALVPPPRQHRHRYYGVLAPNSPLRPAVTALAPEPVAAEPETKPAVETAADDPPVAIGRSPARYLWAMLLARIYEAFPLTCPQCGAEMQIIAFITEAVEVRAILEHIGEPAAPPRIASARGPPEWYEESVEDAIDAEDSLQGDPLAQPEPEYEYDQRVSW